MGRLGIAVLLGVLSVFDAPTASALDECGSGASATCNSSGNPYAGGITYNNANQTVTFQPGVVVNSTNGVQLTGGSSQTVIVNPGVPGVSILSSANGRTALDIQNATGAVTIDAANATFQANGVGSNGVQAITSGNGTTTGGAISITTGNVTLGPANVDGRWPRILRCSRCQW